MINNSAIYWGIASSPLRLRLLKLANLAAQGANIGTLTAASINFFSPPDADPLNIIYKRTNMLIGRVLVGNGARSPEALKYNELFYLFKQSGIMLLMAAAALSLIGMMLTTKANVIEEKKRSFQNKIFLFFILCSSVTLFNAVKQFFDSLIY